MVEKQESSTRLNLSEFLRGEWEYNEAKTPPAHSPATPISISRASISRLPFLRIASHHGDRGHVSRRLLVFFFILLLGILGGLLNYACKRCIRALLDVRQSIAATTDSPLWGGIFWTLYSVSILFISILWTKISPSAIGSGLSQMKVVLTGVDPNLYLPGYFSLSTLIAKFGGVIFSNGAGLVVGSEGAWTHMMSVIAHHLLRLRVFAPLQAKPSTRLQLFAAAAAVAVSSTFGSPIGGVLFSIEVTATYYLISNYMKAFVSAVGSAVVVQATMTLVQDPSHVAYPAHFPPATAHILNVPLAVPLGLFMGILASVLIRAVRRIANLRHTWRHSPARLVRFAVEWLDPLAVVLVTAILFYSPGKYVPDASLQRYFSNETLDLPRVALDGAIPLCLLPLAITLAVPSGVGLPTFAIGAALGRLYGELLIYFWPHLNIVPGAYALIGAASFTGAATRTISTAVVALEITASLQYMLPVFAGTLAAIGVSSVLATESIYDATVDDLPYMPCLDFYSDTTADDIKEPDVVFITRKPTLLSVLVAMNRMRGHAIPVVESDSDRMLLGCISASALQRVVERFYDTNDLGDARADCGLEVEDSDGGSDAGGGLTWTSIKSAVTSLNRATDKRNTVDRIYAAEAGLAMHDSNLIALLSQAWTNKKRDVLRKGRTKLPTTAVQALPITVSSGTLLEDIHMIFLMLRIDHCYVTQQGVLVGVITTNTVINASRDKDT
ncbi:Aste57867_15087 [Aphanomyces stellatus]|uniref:Chloride channel protein n=1 Tax=Aphanomyces stellatus TaxID=120398 RepID=A0A485L3B8_9STRA|nr:hypothetical protein As57867_015031 [Aphanomyces stellatus]VFT91900.1 Aste57867_15087 [Aphanomyces stellatus]